MSLERRWFVLTVGLGLTLGACSLHQSAQEQSPLHDQAFPDGWFCPNGTRAAVNDTGIIPELGFAPAEVLAFAIGVHTAPLRWHEDPTVIVEPESGDETLEITIQRAGDAVLFTPESFFTGHGATCVRWFEIPVRVTLRSESRALDETFVATLRAVQPHVAVLLVSATGRALNGTLAAHLRDGMNEHAATEWSAHLSVSPTNVNGALSARWSVPATSTTPGLATSLLPLAHWGIADCDPRSYAVDVADPNHGALVQSMLDRLARLDALGVMWMDASTTTAHATFTPAAGGACISTIRTLDTWDRATMEGSLALETDDGRLDGTYPVSAHIEDDNDFSPFQIIVSHEIYPSDTPLTPTELGFVHVSVPDVPRPSMSLSIVLNADDSLAESAITLWSNQDDGTFGAAERGTFSR